MSIMKKIRIEKDNLGDLFIYLAWDEDENRIVSPESAVRPELVIEDGLVTQILPNGLDIEIPEFDPFPIEGSLYFLSKKETNTFSEPLAWELSHKLLKSLMTNGKLSDDYEEKIKIMDAEFDKFNDVTLKEHVMSRINQVISEYKATGIWNFVLLGK